MGGGGGGVKCALPKVPASAASGGGGSSAVAGYKFGGMPDSRLEFAKVSEWVVWHISEKLMEAA